MGEVRTATLAAAGSGSSTAKAFSSLEDCEIAMPPASTEDNPIAATTVAVTFTSTPDAADANSSAVGANGGANSAQHVAIRLYDEQGKVVAELNLPPPFLCVRGASTLNFGAKYYSTQGNATAGDANAVATHTVTYS